MHYSTKLAGLVVFAFSLIANGETLRVATSDSLAHLDADADASTLLFLARGLVLESLFNQDPNGDLRPALARSFKMNSDQRTVDVTLRKNVKWSNGEDLKAEDVKRSLALLMDKNHPTLWASYVDDLKTVTVLSSHRLRFHFKRASFTAWRSLALWVRIRPHEKVNAKKFPIGSGPYVVSQFTSGKELVLSKNPRWWGWGTTEGARYPHESLTIQRLSDILSAPAMLKNRQLDAVALYDGKSVQSLRKLVAGEKIQLLQDPMQPSHNRLVLALNVKPTSPLTAQSRERLIGALKDFSKYCVKLGSEATPEDPPAVVSEFGQRPQSLHLTVRFTEENAAAFDILQQHLQAKGIGLEAQRTPTAQLWERLQVGDFVSVLEEWPTEAEPDSAIWHSQSRTGYMSGQNPKIDEELDRLEREFNLAKRKTIAAGIWKKIKKTNAFAQLCQSATAHFAVGPSLRVDDFLAGRGLWSIVRAPTIN